MLKQLLIWRRSHFFGFVFLDRRWDKWKALCRNQDKNAVSDFARRGQESVSGVHGAGGKFLGLTVHMKMEPKGSSIIWQSEVGLFPKISRRLIKTTRMLTKGCTLFPNFESGYERPKPCANIFIPIASREKSPKSCIWCGNFELKLIHSDAETKPTLARSRTAPLDYGSLVFCMGLEAGLIPFLTPNARFREFFCSGISLNSPSRDLLGLLPRLPKPVDLQLTKWTARSPHLFSRCLGFFFGWPVGLLQHLPNLAIRLVFAICASVDAYGYSKITRKLASPRNFFEYIRRSPALLFTWKAPILLGPIFSSENNFFLTTYGRWSKKIKGH